MIIEQVSKTAPSRILGVWENPAQERKGGGIKHSQGWATTPPITYTHHPQPPSEQNGVTH